MTVDFGAGRVKSEGPTDPFSRKLSLDSGAFSSETNGFKPE